MTRNVYSPVRNGFVQESYFAQMGTASIGQLANAGDHNLVDAYAVGPVGADGLIAGFGVVAEAVAGAARVGVNQYAAAYPAAGAGAASLAGIVVRNEQMAANARGEPCWFEGALCNVLRPVRVGGRVWIALAAGAAAADANAHWIVSDAAGHGKPVGAFSAAAMGGDTVEIPWLKFRGAFAAPASGLAAALAEVVVNEACQ